MAVTPETLTVWELLLQAEVRSVIVFEIDSLAALTSLAVNVILELNGKPLIVLVVGTAPTLSAVI